MTRELESEVSAMCNLSQSVEEKGILKGRKEERLLLLKNLMESTGMNIEHAMAALGIPEVDWQKYRKLLAAQ